jgi:iron complex transport system substrate-binding protein
LPNSKGVTVNRRSLLAVSGAIVAAATVLSGCSTGATDATDAPSAATSVDAGAFPVTIDHALGSTTVSEEPRRIVTIGWSDQDTLLSLGVVPVGAQEITWGGNGDGSTDWFDDRLADLGGEGPERYNADTSLPVEDIATMAPDLILATNSGLTRAQYDKLSDIAPTVAYPGSPWLTSWRDSLEMIGRATGRSSVAEKVEHDTQAALDQAQEDFPELVGTSFLVTGVQDNTKLSTIGLYGAGDARPQLLTQLGMNLAPVADRLVPEDSFYTDVSAEKARTLESDVLVNLGYAEGSFEALQDDPLLSRIPAIAADHYVDVTDQPLSLTFSAASPLSIPFFVDRLVPKIAEAVRGGRVDVTG